MFSLFSDYAWLYQHTQCYKKSILQYTGVERTQKDGFFRPPYTFLVAGGEHHIFLYNGTYV